MVASKHNILHGCMEETVAREAAVSLHFMYEGFYQCQITPMHIGDSGRLVSHLHNGEDSIYQLISDLPVTLLEDHIFNQHNHGGQSIGLLVSIALFIFYLRI